MTIEKESFYCYFVITIINDAESSSASNVLLGLFGFPEIAGRLGFVFCFLYLRHNETVQKWNIKKKLFLSQKN